MNFYKSVFIRVDPRLSFEKKTAPEKFPRRTTNKAVTACSKARSYLVPP
jgi:hypothetical protein